METLIVQPKTQKQLAAIKAVLKALDVSYKKEKENFYAPAFVEKIKRGEQAAEEGKGMKVDIANLWK